MKQIFYLLGPTASSKTNTSLHIALKYPFEIINTDVFACYKGSGIMTAKVKENEMNLVKHHLINFLNYEDKAFNVLDYKKELSKCIQTIESRNKLPLVVGGTNYYVELSLFNKPEKEMCEWNDLEKKILRKKEFIKNIDFLYSSCKINERLHTIVHNLIKAEEYYRKKNITLKLSDNLPELDLLIKESEYLNESNKNKLIELKLEGFDPIISREDKIKLLELIDTKQYLTLHNNDIRKIENSIVFFFNNFYEKSNDNKSLSRNLNNPLTFIIYLKIDKEVLKERINFRVREMIYKEGGFIEIIKILDYFTRLEGNIDKLNFEKGILQAIGYKEYFPLVKKILIDEKLKESISLCSTEDELVKFLITNQMEKEFIDCMERVQISTFQYAKYQIKFIEKRILPYFSSNQIYIINPLDKQYLSKIEEFIVNKINFDEEICKTKIANNFISDYKYKIQPFDENIFYNCELCGINNIIKKEYEEHIKSKKHKFNVKKESKSKENK